VQSTAVEAAETLSPVAFGEALAASHGRADDIETMLARLNNSNLTGVPNAIWPLYLYLNYAQKAGLAPFDGTFLAVSPDTPAVRSLLNDSIRWPDGVEVGEFDRPTTHTKSSLAAPPLGTATARMMRLRGRRRARGLPGSPRQVSFRGRGPRA